MAIISPVDLPVVLKVRSDPLKKYVLAKLGFPHVDVEISEDQFEVALRNTGDFISGYFPREQKFAVFYTTPLVSTYPMPEDAYWIQEVSWDPVTTRIDDVFGAESFLFCVSSDFLVLDKYGSLQPVGDWQEHWRAKTPFGAKQLRLKKHLVNKPMPKVRLEYDSGTVEATTSHVVQSNGKWREFGEVKCGDLLTGVKDTLEVQNVVPFESDDAIGLRAQGAGCYYGCTNGEPILIH